MPDLLHQRGQVCAYRRVRRRNDPRRDACLLLLTAADDRLPPIPQGIQRRDGHGVQQKARSAEESP